MLTSDLVRFNKKAGRLTPRYLGAKDRARLGAVAADLVATYSAMVGSTRAELDEAVRAIDHGARDRLIVAGLRKLCEDRTTTEQDSSLDPQLVRAQVFALAARAHREAPRFDRESIMKEAAASLGTTPAELERALFADLRDAQVVAGFEPLEPSELLDRYNLALAQAAMLRSTRVTLRCSDSRPSAIRDLFRAARFFGLIHNVERAPTPAPAPSKRKKSASATASSSDSELVITFDGPFSLFDAVKRYGLRLAMFLPRCLVLEKFSVSAEVEHGPKRERAELTITEADGLRPVREPPTGIRPEIEDLVDAFKGLESHWSVGHAEALIIAADGSVVVPDLVFTHRETNELVYLELLGFWSRAAVFRRIEQIERGLSARLIVAFGKNLRVSEEALDEATAARFGSSLYAFKTTMSAREILARLERQ